MFPLIHFQEEPPLPVWPRQRFFFCYGKVEKLRREAACVTTSFACLEDGQALSDEVEISDIFDVETRASVQSGGRRTALEISSVEARPPAVRLRPAELEVVS